ncbi:STM0539 family protein [Pseudomonas sp. GCEP-101]|uniref:STM0539 family protein n=1 Tax=Pseudomonas sp. GCEP-101 TaxID=2974552 RepID=UPI00223C201F|nr:STM0539 family protein [Pseudomonas sp. GCEP-101]
MLSLLIAAFCLPCLAWAQPLASAYQTAPAVSAERAERVVGSLLTPVSLPVSAVVASVRRITAPLATQITATNNAGQPITLQVPVKAATKARIRPGDRISIEKTRHGNGALLFKNGKRVTYVSLPGETGVSAHKPFPAR